MSDRATSGASGREEEQMNVRVDLTNDWEVDLSTRRVSRRRDDGESTHVKKQIEGL